MFMVKLTINTKVL